MSPTEFRRLQRRAGLLNREVQQLCGVSDQTVINWRHGHTRVPGSAIALLRMIATNSDNREAHRI